MCVRKDSPAARPHLCQSLKEVQRKLPAAPLGKVEPLEQVTEQRLLVHETLQVDQPASQLQRETAQRPRSNLQKRVACDIAVSL